MFSKRFGWLGLLLPALMVTAVNLSAYPKKGHPRQRRAMSHGINILIGQAVEASSTSDNEPAINAVDGDPAQSWCASSDANRAQLTVSLNDVHAISGTGVTWVGEAPRHYKIWYSKDGRRWRRLGGPPNVASNMTSFIATNRPVLARHVKLTFSDKAAPVPCVAEFRAYASPPGSESLIRGADLSTLRALEAAGKTFSDDQGTRPAEQIMADHGYNLVRLRLWVDPPNDFNDLADVSAMALRVEEAGMDLLLDFHYSDFWADPGTQATPAAWQGQDLDTLAHTVYEYTRSVITTLAAQGTTPEIVQIGNEVTAGMLWPQGRIYVGDQQRWTEFTTLLQAGIDGARAGAPAGQEPLIMVHIDRGGDPGGAQWFYEHILDYGVEFDMIGLSYYPYWHGSLTNVRTNLNNLATLFGKPIAIVETAYSWTYEDFDGHPNIIDTWYSPPPYYPVNTEGQSLFLNDLLSVVASTPDDLGRGIVYWEPAWIPGVGWTPGEGNAWENQTLFGPDGQALDSIDAILFRSGWWHGRW